MGMFNSTPSQCRNTMSFIFKYFKKRVNRIGLLQNIFNQFNENDYIYVDVVFDPRDRLGYILARKRFNGGKYAAGLQRYPQPNSSVGSIRNGFKTLPPTKKENW